MVTLDIMKYLLQLALTPAGQHILDDIATGGDASPERVAAEIAKLKSPEPPKEKPSGA